MAKKKYIRGSIEALEFERLPERCKQMFFEYMSYQTINTNNDSPYLVFEVSGLYCEMCKSPIEQILMFALKIVNFNDYYEIYRVEPQIEIETDGKRYIADFCFDTESEEIYYSPYSFENKYKLVIECDGHEYHSSKEQIKKDNERTLALKKAGYDVLHFSGTQIYNEPWGCAKEIIEYIKAHCGEVFDERDNFNGRC